jgi:hypothetical protein
MLIYDRRRCRPQALDEMRRRLTIAQRARLGQLEIEGWRLLFVRGEPAVAFITHEVQGHAMLAREGRPIAVRSLPVRTADTTRDGETAADDAPVEAATDAAPAQAAVA